MRPYRVEVPANGEDGRDRLSPVSLVFRQLFSLLVGTVRRVPP